MGFVLWFKNGSRGKERKRERSFGWTDRHVRKYERQLIKIITMEDECVN